MYDDIGRLLELLYNRDVQEFKRLEVEYRHILNRMDQKREEITSISESEFLLFYAEGNSVHVDRIEKEILLMSNEAATVLLEIRKSKLRLRASFGKLCAFNSLHR